MVSWSYNPFHVHHWVCYKGVCRNVPNPYAVVTLFEASGYCGFWWYFIRKIWSVDHIIIVMFIIECAIRGSAEKSRIHTQWSHFLRLAITVDFDDISLEKYGQLIIQSLSYTSMVGTLRGPRGPKNTEYLSLYNGCASRICTLWL